MSSPPDSTLADPQELIADLQRQLAASNAERDEALARETATAEVLQVAAGPKNCSKMAPPKAANVRTPLLIRTSCHLRACSSPSEKAR